MEKDLDATSTIFVGRAFGVVVGCRPHIRHEIRQHGTGLFARPMYVSFPLVS